MQNAAARKRPVAPKATTKTEASVMPTPAKASFWSRAKVVIIKTAKRVVTFTKTAARKVALVAKAGAKRIKPIAKRAWAVALRPYIQGVAAGLAFGMLIIGAIVTPFVTVATLLVGSFVFFGLARGVRALEQSNTRASRITLLALEIVGRVLQTFVYATSALFALLMSVTSLPFAVFSVLVLVLGYFDVRGAGSIAFLAWCVLSGSWGLGLLWLMWRGARFTAHTTAEVIDVPEYSAIRLRPEQVSDVRRSNHVAVGSEEVAELIDEPAWDQDVHNEQACDACGTHKGAMRVRSNALPFVTSGTGMGKESTPSTDMLCNDCYDLECEDNAIAMTGVSLRKRSCDVALNAIGRAALSEYAASKKDVTSVFWATTAWWRDRRGHHHERQWCCFHDGKTVATVVYDHARKVYRASALGKLIGVKTALGAAKRLASDDLFDEGNAVTRMVEALDAGDHATQAG